jgi:hypothetical protein
MEKQTAIEWLFEMVKSQSEEDSIIRKEPLFFFRILQQAKEMEKEQMKEVAWHFKEVDMEKSNKGNIIDLEFDQYYSETYGK